MYIYIYIYIYIYNNSEKKIVWSKLLSEKSKMVDFVSCYSHLKEVIQTRDTYAFREEYEKIMIL